MLKWLARSTYGICKATYMCSLPRGYSTITTDIQLNTFQILDMILHSKHFVINAMKPFMNVSAWQTKSAHDGVPVCWSWNCAQYIFLQD